MSYSRKTPQQPPVSKNYQVDIAALEQRVLYSAAPLLADVAVVQEADAAEVTTPAADPAENAAAEELPGFIFTEPPAVQTAVAADEVVDDGATAGRDVDFDLQQYDLPVAAVEDNVRHEIAFVDTGVEGYQTLVEDILKAATPQRQIDVVLLSGDGVSQITQALKNATDVDAVHLFSHGDGGVLHAGDVRLSSQNLHVYAGQIASWSAGLNADADILIYGCEMAGSTLGRSLLFSLSDLTGADVAASDNDTGNAAAGGDWVLEFSAGAIETQTVIDAQTGAQWDGVLAGTGFAPTGETQVNEETTDEQATQGVTEGVNNAIAANPAGDYVVVWTSHQQDGDNDGVYFRLYDKDGNPRTGELRANQETGDNQGFGEVAMHDNGSFVITWTSKEQDGDAEGIYARMFNADGTAAGNEFRVNVETSGEQRASSISMAPGGSFVITWEDKDNKTNIYARRYNAAGVALDPQEFRVNRDHDVTEMTNASVSVAGNGNFVVVWEYDSDVYYRRFAADGTALDADDVRVNTSASDAAVATDSSGNFAVTYRRSSVVWVQMYNADGSSNGSAMKVSGSSATDDGSPSISMNAAGEFAVVYHGGDGNGDGIFVRTYDATGVAQGDAVQVNETTTGNQQFASVTLHDVNNYVVAWSGEGATDSDGVFIRQYGTVDVESPPVADAGGPYTIAEGDGVTFSAAGSTDADGDTLSYAWDLDNDGDYDDATGESVSLTWAQLQALGIDDDGTFNIGVEVSDGDLTDVAAAVLTVTNTGPTAVNDNGAGYNVGEDASFTTASVLTNDSDPVDPLTVTAIDTTGTVGTVTSNGDGTFSYDTNGQFEYLAAGQQTTDTFVYTISDGDGGTAQATVTITITGANDPVIANDDTVAVTEDTPRIITFASLFGNDTNVDSDTLTLTAFTPPASGTLVDNGNNTFTYTPGGNFNGADTFTYTVSDGNGSTDTATVTLNVAAVNDTPEANEDVVNTLEDTPVTFSRADLLLNDTDDDGHTLTIDSFTQPANGTLVDNGDGTFTYTPGAGFTGLDPFTYTVSDGNGGFDTATVNANVGAVNNAPDARDDTIAGVEDTTLNFSQADLLANDLDLDGDTVAFESYTLPAIGSLVDNGDGTFSFTPPADFNGPVTFTYTVNDGNGEQDTATVTLTMAAVNDEPVTGDDTVAVTEDTPVTFSAASLLANDSDADGDGLTISSFTQPAAGMIVDNGDGTFTFTPAADDDTPRTFTYDANDGNGGITTATVTLHISAVNDEPVANADAFTVNEDTTLVIPRATLLGNDTDVEGDTLSITSVTSPAHGSLVDRGDGTFAYTPDSNYFGTDNFTYHIADGNGGVAQAVVTITVQPVDDAPLAGEDTLTTVSGGTQIISASQLLANDSDVEGAALTLVSVSAPGSGTLSVNSLGQIVYTPASGFAGVDSFTYTVTDGANTTTSTVNVVVTAIAAAPEAEAELELEEVEAEEAEAEALEATFAAAAPASSSDEEEQLAGPIRRREESSNAVAGNTVVTIHAGNIKGVDVAEVVAAAREQAAAALGNRAVERDFAAPAAVEIDGAGVYTGIGMIFDSPPPVATQTQLETQFGAVAAGSAAMFSVSFSVGYVLWTVRGGYLLSSVLAQMPAWRFIDPLPIIDYEEDSLEDEEDESTPHDRDESLVNIIDNHDSRSTHAESPS